MPSPITAKVRRSARRCGTEECRGILLEPQTQESLPLSDLNSRRFERIQPRNPRATLEILGSKFRESLPPPLSIPTAVSSNRFPSSREIPRISPPGQEETNFGLAWKNECFEPVGYLPPVFPSGIPATNRPPREIPGIVAPCRHIAR